jgi:hypothetical protein
MIDWNTLKAQTLGYRSAIASLARNETDRVRTIPPTWNNNLHWHAGHLVVTPCLLTYGLMGEPLPIPAEYRRWFAKGTSPAGWNGETLPSYEKLADEMLEIVPGIFADFENRTDTPYAGPYATSIGVPLNTPAEALTFSLAHDGIHFGMIQALIRGLNGMKTVSEAADDLPDTDEG